MTWGERPYAPTHPFIGPSEQLWHFRAQWRALLLRVSSFLVNLNSAFNPLLTHREWTHSHTHKPDAGAVVGCLAQGHPRPPFWLVCYHVAFEDSIMSILQTGGSTRCSMDISTIVFSKTLSVTFRITPSLENNLTPWMNYPSSSHKRNNAEIILLTCCFISIGSLLVLCQHKTGSLLALPQISTVTAEV